MKCQARAECRPGTQSLGATPGAKTRMLSVGDEPGKARPQPEPRTATRDIGSEARCPFTPGPDCIALALTPVLRHPAGEAFVTPTLAVA